MKHCVPFFFDWIIFFWLLQHIFMSHPNDYVRPPTTNNTMQCIQETRKWKNNSLFWPKERLFCHSCTYNYWIMNEFWTWLDIFIDYIGQVGVNVRWYLCECFILWHHFWQVCVHIKSKTSSHPLLFVVQPRVTRLCMAGSRWDEGGRMFSRFCAHKLAKNDVTI
jgi:hypothetical protein